MFRELLSVIEGKDELCRNGQGDYNMIMAGILVQPLETSARTAFITAGWDVADLPSNPYILRAD